jgi:hypothetical protein
MKIWESFAEVIDNATVIFDNDPKARLAVKTAMSPTLPVLGVTSGGDKDGHLNGTITDVDLGCMLRIMEASGWLVAGTKLSVLIFDPTNPWHAVLAKTITPVNISGTIPSN